MRREHIRGENKTNRSCVNNVSCWASDLIRLCPVCAELHRGTSVALSEWLIFYCTFIRSHMALAMCTLFAPCSTYLGAANDIEGEGRYGRGTHGVLSWLSPGHSFLS